MRTALLVMCNETYKRILVIWDYKFNVLVQLIMVGIIFIGASFLLGGGQFNPAQLASLFLGYVVWFYARLVIMGTSGDIIGEAESGTLEQMYMTPAPTEMLILGHVLATLITTTIMVLLTAFSLLLILHISVPFSWEAIPVLALTMVGLFGFTLTLAGAALVFKQIEALADLLQNLLLFLTGSLLPITHFPTWLATIARTLPITQGIDVLRNVVLTNQSLPQAWANGSLGLLVLNSAIYLVTGWLIFKWCERTAKKQGSLSHY
ncbi:MAG TPA: ABC transporter permease [Ktedonobacteraceae bacterium]|nr:ABC transporter permease [Ktedonobacteraceae bacterium]